MDTNPMTVARYLQARLVAGRENDLTDGELLGVFAASKDEPAFAALIARHGPLVLGVCRRLLGNPTDADDAFQAVFLVLAQRADGLREVRSVSGWLYGTAVRVAMKARTREARRRARERKATLMRQPDRPADAEWDDIRPILDEELGRLDERYRAPIVLCCLEGRSRDEAAQLLGWPEGTVSGRLARAKELLRDRLARRGIACSVAALTALLSERSAIAVPTELARATLSTVSGTASASVAELVTAAARGWNGWRLGIVGVVGLAATVATAAFLWSPKEPNQPPITDSQAQPTPIRLTHGSEVLGVAVSRDGLIATTGPGSEVRLWKADGTAAARCNFPGGGAAVSFGPQGQTLAAAGYDGTVRVWDTKTGRLQHALQGHGETAQAVAFSPDGKLLATAGEDGRVRLWDAATGRLIRDYEGHRGRVWAVCFSPDSNELVSGGGDQTVRVWNPTEGTETHRFSRLRGGAYAVEYHPTRQMVAIAAHNTVLLLDAHSGRELGQIRTARTAVTWFAFAPDGRTIAYRDGRVIRIWEIASEADRLTIELSAEPAAVAFVPGGRSLIAAVGNEAEIIEFRGRVHPLVNADANALWAHLTGADTSIAYRAVVTLAADPKTAVTLIREKLHAFPNFRVRVDALIHQLGDDAYQAREQASQQLLAIGPDAAPALRRALTNDPSPEVRLRADRLLKQLPAKATSAPTPIEARAVEVLEMIGNTEAKEALSAIAAREIASPLKQEAAAALSRLRNKKP